MTYSPLPSVPLWPATLVQGLQTCQNAPRPSRRLALCKSAGYDSNQLMDVRLLGPPRCRSFACGLATAQLIGSPFDSGGRIQPGGCWPFGSDRSIRPFLDRVASCERTRRVGCSMATPESGRQVRQIGKRRRNRQTSATATHFVLSPDKTRQSIDSKEITTSLWRKAVFVQCSHDMTPTPPADHPPGRFWCKATRLGQLRSKDIDPAGSRTPRQLRATVRMLWRSTRRSCRPSPDAAEVRPLAAPR